MENIKVTNNDFKLAPARPYANCLAPAVFNDFAMFFPDRSAKLVRLTMDGLGKEIDVQKSKVWPYISESGEELYLQFYYESGNRCFLMFKLSAN